MNIGFCGIGMMGHGMATNLVTAGHRVYVYNRTKDKAEQVKGATVVNEPSELGENAELVIMCLSNDEAIKNVCFSEKGIFKSISNKHVLIDSSTTSVNLTEELTKKSAESSIKFLDAPVTGGKKGADAGTLLYMIGGNEETFDTYREIFAVMGDKLVYCGKNGNGQKMKIALNITQAMTLQSYLEGTVLALKNGLELNVIRDALDNSGARSNVALSKMPAIIHQDFLPNFYMSLMSKDSRLANEEIKKLGLNLPLANTMIKVFADALEQGLGDKDWVAIANMLQKNNSVKIE